MKNLLLCQLEHYQLGERNPSPPRAYHAAMMGMMSRLAALFRRRLILL
jgi:hypothetical protein